MEENLIDLIKSYYFSNDEQINLKQICSILNKKCTKNRSLSLENLLKEIDEIFASQFVKEMEQKYTQLEQYSLNLLMDIDNSIDSMEKVQETGSVMVDQYAGVVKSIEYKYEEIKELEEKYKDLENRERMLEIISNIQTALVLEDIDLASDQVASFIEQLHGLQGGGASALLKKEMCSKLSPYHTMIQDQLIKSFQDCILDINWPFISNGFLRTSSELDTTKFDMVADKFSQHFRNLYIIELSEDLKEPESGNGIDINTTFMEGLVLENLCLPVRLLVKPFIKYFRYFFWTESKINKIGKPEWYMTQVIQWISIHQVALDHMFTSSLLDSIDVKVEFIRALVIMVMEKIHKDLDLTRTNDDLYFHLVEESLTMTMDLRTQFDYPETYPDPIDVVCNDEDHFQHWMMLEQRFALKQLDDVFLSAESWRPLSSKCKRVECMESFIGIIESMKQRIECISEVRRRSRFCQILLDVIENYRLRLLQVTKNYEAKTKRWYDIMNVVLGVKTFLRGWTLDRTFIEVYEYNNNEQMTNHVLEPGANERKTSSLNPLEVSAAYTSSSSSIYSSRVRVLECRQLQRESLFSNVLSLYQHVLDGLESSCQSAEFEDLLGRAEPYLKRSWLIPGPLENQSLVGLSSSASGLMLLLRDRLHELEKALEPELFGYIWQSLAHRLNNLLFKEVILAHRFTEAGALQLDVDLRRNLLSVFILYSKNPHRFFVDCLEASVLLNLKWGTAMLIKDLLKQSLHDPDQDSVLSSESSSSRSSESPLRALNELGIFSLSPDVAEVILDLRIDPNLL